MRAVQSHPVWWSPAKQLAFLVDLSDRVESEDREVLPSERALLTSLESMAKAAIGTALTCHVPNRRASQTVNFRSAH
jgi:hypothetical protein